MKVIYLLWTRIRRNFHEIQLSWSPKAKREADGWFQYLSKAEEKRNCGGPEAWQKIRIGREIFRWVEGSQVLHDASFSPFFWKIKIKIL